MDCSPPGSAVSGILQARILEWVAISFSRVSSQPRDWTCVSFTGRQVLYHWGSREALSVCSVRWGPREAPSICSVHWGTREAPSICSVRWGPREALSSCSVHWGPREALSICSMHWGPREALSSYSLLGILGLCYHHRLFYWTVAAAFLTFWVCVLPSLNRWGLNRWENRLQRSNNLPI